MIGFLLLTLFPLFDPLVHRCPSLLIGCTYHGSTHFPTLHALFRGPPFIASLAADSRDFVVLCIQIHTTIWAHADCRHCTRTVHILALVVSFHPLPLPLSPSGSFLIANSQTYLVRSGRALIRSSCLPCVLLVLSSLAPKYIVV